LVGGSVAADRQRPRDYHGKDLVIIQASHVGYDPVKGRFGVYRRLQTEQTSETSNCGKICGALDWYQREYEFACDNIRLYQDNGSYKVMVDNQLLHADRDEGLLLELDKIVKVDGNGNPIPEISRSTAKVFSAAQPLLSYLQGYEWKSAPGEAIGRHLHPNLFRFKRNISHHQEGRDHLEKNLIDVMPYVVTSEWPALTAAQANTQVEFDRAFRTIIQDPAYRDKKVLFISGLNVDISPQEGQVFPLTKFIPWAAYVQDEHGNHQTWEQAELYEKLQAQSSANADQIDLESAIEIMESAAEIQLPF